MWAAKRDQAIDAFSAKAKQVDACKPASRAVGQQADRAPICLLPQQLHSSMNAAQVPALHSTPWASAHTVSF